MDLGRLLAWWRTSDPKSPESDERPVNTSRDLRIVRHIQEQGGRTTHRKLVDHLAVPEETVDRDLDDLETADVIVRHRTDQQDVVELNEEQAADALVRRGDQADA